MVKGKSSQAKKKKTKKRVKRKDKAVIPNLEAAINEHWLASVHSRKWWRQGLLGSLLASLLVILLYFALQIMPIWLTPATAIGYLPSEYTLIAVEPQDYQTLVETWGEVDPFFLPFIEPDTVVAIGYLDFTDIPVPFVLADSEMEISISAAQVTPLGRYVLLTPAERLTVAQITEVTAGKQLKSEKFFRELLHNLPTEQTSIRSYAAPELLTGYQQLPQFGMVPKLNLAYLQPLVKNLGSSLVTQQPNGEFWVYTNHNPEEKKLPFVPGSSAYQGELLQRVPADPLFLVGAEGLAARLLAFADWQEAGAAENYFALATKGLNIPETAFTDLLGILSEELLIAIYENESNAQKHYLIGVNDLDLQTWNRFQVVLIALSDYFNPEISTVTLQDGTTGRVAIPRNSEMQALATQRVVFTDVDSLAYFDIPKADRWYFWYNQEAEELYASNDLEIMRKLAEPQSHTSFTAQPLYESQISEQIGHADEMVYVAESANMVSSQPLLILHTYFWDGMQTRLLPLNR